MYIPSPISAEVVSSRAYARILSSSQLQRKLLPEGLAPSPYEILDYDVTLVLHDAGGLRATFQRTQQVRFLQDGVGGLLDHAWGDGVIVTSYHHGAGTLEGALHDDERRHFVIGLRRPMAKGETLRFGVERTVMAGFMGAEEWMETTIDHPVTRVRKQIVFPKARPCQSAWLAWEGGQLRLPVQRLADGRSQVRVDIVRPQSFHPYLIRWSW